MTKKKILLFALVMLLIPALLVACGTSEETDDPEPTDPPAPTDVPPEPTDVPEPAVDPSGQTISFWHVWGSDEPGDAMVAAVEAFNVTNEWGITVEAYHQGRYDDAENAFNVAIQSGDLPSTIVGYTNALSNWYNVDSIVDLNQFVNDPMYGFSADELGDMYAGALNGALTPDGARVGWAFSQSANVLWYNNTWAQELGFDAAPTTSAEFKEQVCAASEANNNDDDPDNDGTGGMVLYTGAENPFSWVKAFGGRVLNEAGDGYDMTNQALVDALLFMKDLQDSGCTFVTESYPNPEFATRKALYVTSSTAGLPYQLSAFEDAGSTDEWSFSPFVGPDGGKAIDAYVQYISIVKTNPEQELATWLFVKYVTSPEVQANWISSSAYFPTQGATVPLIADFIAANPVWSTGLDLGEYGFAEPALASWSSVRRAFRDALDAILAAETEAEVLAILAELQATADELVAERD